MTLASSAPFGSSRTLTLLSQLLLKDRTPESGSFEDMAAQIARLSRADFEEVLTFANSHHVVVRGLQAWFDAALATSDTERAEWAAGALSAERARIENAISFLQHICAEFIDQGHKVLVIKSLDHWPDLGSDLDLYLNAEPADVIGLMKQKFRASIAPRSWGDRLAGKWNFIIPGLPEAVEIHVGRLGQTGEQTTIAECLTSRARFLQFGSHLFRVPSASDRLMISTLQRMYRHFYFRLCDIVDNGELARSGSIDYRDLYASARSAGIWEGVATYLVIVSGYIQHYRGTGLDLPSIVGSSARFGGERLRLRNGFLRVPIVPESALLYTSQLGALFRKRQLKSSARLSLLPCLATAAAVGQKITGSDKGIW